MAISKIVPPDASEIIFNNTNSTLTSTNVQDAIDELDNEKVNKSGGTISGNITIDRQNGTTTTEGESALVLGNNIAVGTDKNSTGAIYVFKGDKYLVLRPNTLNGNKTITLPNEIGTLALTSDIFEYTNVLANNTDLDNITNIGNYVIVGGYTYTNKPSDAPNAHGKFKVEKVMESSNTLTIQTFEVVNEGVFYSYKRAKWNATAWQSWHKISYV